MFMDHSYFKTNQTLCCIPFVGDDGNFHYVYKMINKSNGKYYVGIHSTKQLDDGYCGSGTNITKAINDEGPGIFVKLILSFHKTPRDLEDAEAALITEKEINDPLCYNINCGGGHHPTKSVTCIDLKLNKNVRVPRDEYYAHPERYISPTKGQIKAQDNTGKIFMVKTDDPRFKTGEIWDYVAKCLKGTFPAFDVATGKNIRVRKDDPRLLTGEVIHIQKGRVKVMRDGVVKVIHPSKLQDYLASGWEKGGGLKGVKRGPSKVAGRCHVWKGSKVLVVQKSELDQYIADGWKRGLNHCKH